VAQSTRADTRTDPASGFHYCWWTRPDPGARIDFWAQGNHGQFTHLAPGPEVVLVRLRTG
jgi:hypothetical protein